MRYDTHTRIGKHILTSVFEQGVIFCLTDLKYFFLEATPCEVYCIGAHTHTHTHTCMMVAMSKSTNVDKKKSIVKG